MLLHNYSCVLGKFSIQSACKQAQGTLHNVFHQPLLLLLFSFFFQLIFLKCLLYLFYYLFFFCACIPPESEYSNCLRSWTHLVDTVLSALSLVSTTIQSFTKQDFRLYIALTKTPTPFLILFPTFRGGFFI